MVMLKSKLDVLEQQNKNLKKELSRKDHAFMKCGDLCAFLSQVLSNEYVTLQRTKEGFKEPLGLTQMRDQQHHMMNQFKWSNEEEDAKYHPPDEVDKARIHQIREIRRVMTYTVEVTDLKGKGSPKEAAKLNKKFTMTAEHGSELNVSDDGYQDERRDRPISSHQH